MLLSKLLLNHAISGRPYIIPGIGHARRSVPLDEKPPSLAGAMRGRGCEEHLGGAAIRRRRGAAGVHRAFRRQHRSHRVRNRERADRERRHKERERERESERHGERERERQRERETCYNMGLRFNHFRTAAPLWRQSTQFLSTLFSKRDCSPKKGQGQNTCDWRGCLGAPGNRCFFFFCLTVFFNEYLNPWRCSSGCTFKLFEVRVRVTYCIT